MLKKDCLRSKSEPDSDFTVVELSINHTRITSLSSCEIRSTKSSAPILKYNILALSSVTNLKRDQDKLIILQPQNIILSYLESFIT